LDFFGLKINHLATLSRMTDFGKCLGS
jgi:hypothetical protein